MSKYIWGDSETQFFFHLGPDVVLNAIDSVGLKTTGRVLTLNSMENRVYEVEIERPQNEIKSPSDNFIVAKFYRPGRWSPNQLQEEHDFLRELMAEEIPVIAPMEFNGRTIFEVADHNIMFAIFPKKSGRSPEEMGGEYLEIIGRLLARIHNVGAVKKAEYRISINPDSFGLSNLEFLLSNNFIPSHLSNRFKTVVENICQLSRPLFSDILIHRIHGDCHSGNIIVRDQEGPYFIDFDDMLMGPVIQDIWLVVPGTDQEAIINRNILIESYESMRPFDYRSLKLIEPLRSLRYIHFAAWIAKRWDDPYFKHTFTHYGTDAYWETLISDLQYQFIKISEQASDSSNY